MDKKRYVKEYANDIINRYKVDLKTQVEIEKICKHYYNYSILSFDAMKQLSEIEYNLWNIK